MAQPIPPPPSQPSPTLPENTGLPSSAAELFDRVSRYSSTLPTNLHKAVTDVDAKGYIRLVAIVGAYILARPFIEKFFAWWMMPKDPDELREEAYDAAIAKGEAGIDETTGLPRTMNGGVVVRAGDIRGTNKQKAKDKEAEDVDKKDSKDGPANINAKTTTTTTSAAIKKDTGAATGATDAEWGQNARRRQNKNPAAEAEGGADEEREEMDPALLEGWDY